MNTDTLGAVAERVADQLTALHSRYEAGALTLGEFVDLALAFLDASRAQAVALADLALAAELSLLRDALVAPLGIEPPAPLPATAVVETLDSEQYAADAAAAVGVLARAVTLAAAQEATHEGMRRHDVTHWTRDPNPGACEVCTDLANGIVPVGDAMWTHKGCGCAQRPVA